MIIQPATLEDCRAIAEVHVLSWQHAYRDLLPAHHLAALSVEKREAMWRESLAKGLPQLLVARNEGRVVGFIAFGPSRDPGVQARCAEIWALYLAPSSWSLGAGRLLWLAALEGLVAQGFQAVSLWVLVGNERAIRFYAAAGFEPEPGSVRAFMLGGARLQDVRYVFQCGAIRTHQTACAPTGADVTDRTGEADPPCPPSRLSSSP